MAVISWIYIHVSWESGKTPPYRPSGTESKTALNIGHTLEVMARYAGLLLVPAECFKVFCALRGEEKNAFAVVGFLGKFWCSK